MSGGLRYLATRSARNRLRQFGLQLRKPGYLVAAIVGVGYLVLLLRAPRSQPSGFGRSATEVVGALGILVLAVSAWIFATGRSLLEVSGAERTLLLPAPVPPGRILNFRLTVLQLPVWRNVVLWTLLSGAGLGIAMLLQHAAALWILLTTLQWHRLAAAKVQTVAEQSGKGGRATRIVGILLLASVPFLMTGALGENLAGLKVILEGLASSPQLKVLLWPFAVPLRPFTASSTTSFLSALPAALALLVAHYAWLQHLGIDAETARPVERTTSRGAPLWRLTPRGSVAWAFLWKNLTALFRRPTAVLAAGAALLIILAPVVLRSLGRGSAAELIGWMTLVWGIILLVVGPQFVRNDLRRDQMQLELLRSMPVRGYDLLLGSTAAAACALALAAGTLLVTGVLGTSGSPDLPVPQSRLTEVLAGALLLLGPLCLAAIIIQDAALLLFPGWSRLTARRGSPTALGANIANSALTLVLLAALLVLPLATGTLASGGTDAPWAPVRLGLVAGLLLGVECWVLLRWLGSRFDAMDLIRTTG